MSAIVKSLCFSFIILASFATLFTVTDAWRFNVGGNGVWSIHPQENYKTWAERNRFQVNDTLYFKYPKGSDSVQRVMEVDFNGCNVRNPLDNFDNGESVVTLNRSGPFYFISGNQDHCLKGQKLIVVVLAVRNHHTVPISPAKPPSTANPPKSSSPVSPIAPAHPPSTAQPPKSSSPATSPSKSQPPKSSVSPTQPPKSSSPVSHSPSLSPSHAPAKSPATPSPSPKSPSPVSHSPSLSPSHAPTQSPATPSPSPKSPSPVSHSPSLSPSHAPTQSPATPSPSPKSPSPPSPSPAQSPTSSPAEQTPTSSPSPSETTPSSGQVTAPAPSPKNSAIGVAVTSVMTTVLSATFTVLMLA